MVVKNERPASKLVPVRLIVVAPDAPPPNMGHARRLADSIAEEGQIQPIGLYPFEDWLRLWYGRHRLEAFKMLGLSDILATVYTEEPSPVELVCGRLAENVAARTVSQAELVPEILSLQALDPTLTYKAIGKRIGVSQSGMSRIMCAYLKLPEWARTLVPEPLCPSGAYSFSQVPEHLAEKRDAMIRQAVAEKWKRDKIEEQVAVLRGRKPPKVKRVSCEVCSVDLNFDPKAPLEELDFLSDMLRKARKIAQSTGQGMAAIPSIIAMLAKG